MSIVDGIIVAPINNKEPYIVMGLGTYNGVYDVGYAGQNSHKKINPWSKHKPLRVKTPKDLTDAQFALDDGSYGLVIIDKDTEKEIIGSLPVSLSDIKDCIRWSTLAYGKYHFCCFFSRANLYYTAMAQNNLEELDIEILYPIGKQESNVQLGTYTYMCYLGLCSEDGDQILPLPQFGGKLPLFTLNVVSVFNGHCSVEKIGSYNGQFNGGDIRDTATNITNYQPPSYYDGDIGNNPLKVYNGTGVAFKLNITLYETMSIDIAEFGIKAFNLPTATEYNFWMQLSTENATRTNGNITFTANTPVTVYAICVAANIFPPGTSYIPILYCRGAQMAEVVELQIDRY